MRPTLALLLLAGALCAAEPEFPITEDSKPQPNVAKGTMLKETYIAKDDSVFPGTQREYQVYLPAGHDASKPAAFMVFQDGVIYQAPTVFDNLIAKKDIPAMIGIFIKPGVVPAANENALPRFNRSHEYDSVTDVYSQFLIDEFLPAIEAKHKIKLSTDPNHAAISGNSSGGICAYMVAWHRPDRFRRVFTGVGTYVGIHGADQLPVWLRKEEPKPIRVFLQSGTGDNNLYCGDWWMANQTMERSLAWAGYEVNHAWGEGGHNGKHATQIFPDVLRWLWKNWQTTIEVKANAKGESKWKGYDVVGAADNWRAVALPLDERLEGRSPSFHRLAASGDGTLYAIAERFSHICVVPVSGESRVRAGGAVRGHLLFDLGVNAQGAPVVLYAGGEGRRFLREVDAASGTEPGRARCFVRRSDGQLILGWEGSASLEDDPFAPGNPGAAIYAPEAGDEDQHEPQLAAFRGVAAFEKLCFSPDQTLIYATSKHSSSLFSVQLIRKDVKDPFGPRGVSVTGFAAPQRFGDLETIRGLDITVGGLCVDTEGRLYVATSLGIQVCDQAGRVNFIIPTPKPARDVCFAGKDLSELYIACGDTIYKRSTKAKGVVSGQQAPMKPAAPKL